MSDTNPPLDVKLSGALTILVPQQNPSNQAPPQQPLTLPPYYLSFVGFLNPPASNKLRVTLGILAQNGYKDVTLLFCSGGGSIDEGLSLYSYIRALPYKITMHAIGPIDSIAVPVFLAAQKEKRFCSSTSRFTFHDISMEVKPGSYSGAQINDANLITESSKSIFMQILQSETSFRQEDFKSLNLYNETRIISPGTAQEKGIVKEIKDASIPFGCHVGVIEY